METEVLAQALFEIEVVVTVLEKEEQPEPAEVLNLEVEALIRKE